MLMNRDVMDASTIFSVTNLFPIVPMMELTGIVLNRLSNVLLSGNVRNPHDFIIFLLYRVLIEK